MKRNHICSICYSSYESQRSDSKYCSKRCRQAAYVKRCKENNSITMNYIIDFEQSVISKISSISYNDRDMLWYYVNAKEQTSLDDIRLKVIECSIKNIIQVTRLLSTILLEEKVSRKLLNTFTDEYARIQSHWAFYSPVSDSLNKIEAYIQRLLNDHSNLEWIPLRNKYPEDLLQNILGLNVDETICNII